MQANKYTVTIEIEVLAMDVVPSLLRDVASAMAEGNYGGSLHKDDGDCVRWEARSERVDF